MKRTPLLDLGNVVVQVDFQPFLTWLSRRAGHTGTDRVSALLSSSLFYDFEFGHISRAEFTRRVSKLYGASFPAAELEQEFCGIFPGLVEGIEPLMEELAADGPLYCLSNTNEIHLSYLRERFPVMSKFTRIFASHEMGRRKPYPGIYRDVAHELGLEPRDLVFFDDVHANVRGALRAGLEAHVFDGVEGMRARLPGSDELSRLEMPAEPACALSDSDQLKDSKELDDNESGGGFGHG
jgi:HAD superfamily hydrolase (TIGR01509 family)